MLHRSTTQFATDGRTLTGLALPWDQASDVTDDGETFYPEMFVRSSVNKTLQERAAVPWPLGYSHPWTPGSIGSNSPYADEQLGTVKFRASDEGLVFVTRMFTTDAADEILANVNDGKVNDVSIGFNPYKHDELDGTIVRTEIGLVELSLTPTGTGQHQGAGVLAVRAHAKRGTSLAEVRRNLDWLGL